MAQDESKVELELWNYEGCPFGQRAWWAILYKKIPADKYIVHWEDLANKSDGFKAAYKQALFANPEKEGTTPTIKHKGNYITESDVCAKYINRSYDGPNLVPTDPYSELLADAAVKKCFGPLISNMFGILKGEDAKGEKLLAALKVFNESLNSVSKEGFFCGKECTLFEIMVFPVLFRFEAVEALTGVPLVSKWLNSESGCDEAKALPRVINWYNTVNEMESVKEMRKKASLEALKKSFAKFQKK